MGVTIITRETDADWRRFIDRYIPGYIFFAGGIAEGYDAEKREDIDSDSGDGSRWTSRTGGSWRGNGLAIGLGSGREVARVDRF